MLNDLEAGIIFVVAVLKSWISSFYILDSCIYYMQILCCFNHGLEKYRGLLLNVGAE